MNGMGDISMQLDPTVAGTQGTVFIEPTAATVAKSGAQMIFAAAAVASVSQFATGHGNKMTAPAFNDLQVAHNEPVVKRDGAERVEALILASLFKQLDANFGNIHTTTPRRGC
jgi:hypothetical protein